MTKAEIVNNENRMDAGSGNFRRQGKMPEKSFLVIRGIPAKIEPRGSQGTNRESVAAGLGPGDFFRVLKGGCQ
jgi:hypothetical protein